MMEIKKVAAGWVARHNNIQITRANPSFGGVMVTSKENDQVRWEYFRTLEEVMTHAVYGPLVAQAEEWFKTA